MSNYSYFLYNHDWQALRNPFTFFGTVLEVYESIHFTFPEDSMRSSIFNLLSLFLVVAFAASCGKKSSNSASSTNSSSTFTATGSSSGQVAYDSLKAWHDSTSDNTQLGIHGIYLKKSVSSFLVPQMCLKNTIVVDCVDPTGCFKSTDTGVMVGVVEMNRTSIFGITSKKYGDCNITNSFTPYLKKNNVELSEAVLGSTGKFLIKSLTQKSNSIYKVFYGSFSGSITPTSYAIINISLPSIVNPTEVGQINGSQVSKGVVLLNYQIVN
jgi:hypothetical protein